MLTFVRMALWCICGLLASSGGASAQTDARSAEELMRRSGLWEQLSGVAPQARAGLLAALAQGGARPSTTEMERLTRAVDLAYAPQRLRGRALAQVRRGLDAKHVPALRRWYATPNGKQITALEESASSDVRDPQALMAEGVRLLDEMPTARRDLLSELVRVTRGAEAMVQLTINVTVATQRGASSVAPNLPGASEAQTRAMLDAQRPQMVQAYTAMLMASMAQTYAPLPTGTLAQYVEFVKSSAGQHFNDVAMKAFDAAMVEAATDLGRRLPTSKDQANT